MVLARHSRPHRRGGAVVALRCLLVLAAVGVVWGGWRLVAPRPAPGPTPPRAAGPGGPVELPFDRPRVEDGTWILEIGWSGTGEAAPLHERLAATRAFVADGRFAALFPEAEGHTLRVRITCMNRPAGEALRALREMAKEDGEPAVEFRVLDARGKPVALE